MWRRAVVITLLFALGAVPDASARVLQISQQLLDGAGDPLLAANDPSGGAIEWAVCPAPGSQCLPATTGATFAAGLQPPGTTFTATAGSASGRSDVWGGRVTAVAPPRLDGKAIVGTRVRVRAGLWTGGWPGDDSTLRVQACRKRSATSCETLSAPLELGGSGAATVTVDPHYEGWYLFAVDNRFARDTVRTLIGSTSARSVPPLSSPARPSHCPRPSARSSARR